MKLENWKLQLKKTDLFYIFLYINVFCKGIGLNNSSKLYLVLLCVGLVALFIKLLYDKFSKKELAIVAFMLLVGVGSFICTKRVTFLLTCITLAGMKNVEIDKTFKGIFIIRTITFITMVSLSLLGIIENIDITMYRRGEFDTRYALGYTHPNITQINLFIIIALYIYLKYEKLNIMDYIIMIVANCFIYSYTLSRTGVVCIFILIGLTIYSKIIKKDKLLAKLPKTIFLILLIFSILTAVLYGHIDVMKKLDNFFNGRIRYSNYYWNTYGLSLLGKDLVEDTSAIFDNGYLYILIQFGILGLGTIMYLFFKIFKDVKLTNNVKRAVIIIPFLIYIFTESFAPNIFINIILLFAAPLIFNTQGNTLKKNSVKLLNTIND